MENESDIKNEGGSPEFPPKCAKKVSFSDEIPDETDNAASDIKIENGKIPISTEMSPFDYAFQNSANYMKKLHESTENLKLENSQNETESDKLGPSSVFPNERKWSIHSDKSENLHSILKAPKEELPPKGEDVKVDEKSLENLNELIFESKNSFAELIAAAAEGDAQHCSVMELEVRRDKLRWLLISECSAILGEDKHSPEGFHRQFLSQVKLVLKSVPEFCA